MADWFYAQGGQQFGPLNDQALINLLRQGSVQPTDLVWRDGMPNWAEARTVPEIAGALQQQPQQYQQPTYQQSPYQQPQYQSPQYPQGTPVPVGYYRAQPQGGREPAAQLSRAGDPLHALLLLALRHRRDRDGGAGEQ